MKVYRYQHPESKKGPYTGGKFYGHREIDIYYGARHPNPSFDDPFKVVDRSHVFGFHSLRAFVRWFNRVERRFIEAAGFKVVAVEVPDNEVQFTRDKAQCLFPGKYVGYTKDGIAT